MRRIEGYGREATGDRLWLESEKKWKKFDRVFGRIVMCLCLFIGGIGFGYWWAVAAYGVLR